MLTDQCELDVSAAAPSVIDAIDHFRVALISLGAHVGDIIAAADAHPDAPLLQAYAASFYLFGQTGDAQAQGEAYLARAASLLPRCNPREACFIKAATAWDRGEHEAALDELEALCREWPRDLVAAKVAEFHYYCTGQAWNARRFLRLMNDIAPHNAAEPHFLAMQSFACELSGDRDAALRLADAALAIEPDTPWAHHSLAHVYLMNGDLETGIHRLTGERMGWRRFGPVAHAHNAWHLALFHLERLDVDAVMEIYRNDVWGHDPDLVTEQLDAISLLWRLDLADRPQDSAWQDVVDHVLPRSQECFIPFINAHFVYALARAGATDALGEALRSARHFAARQRGERARAWSVGVPLLEGCAALGRGDPAEYARKVAPILHDVGRVGGSDAQVALFLESYLIALIRSDQRSAAREYLQSLRATRRQRSALDDHWRSKCE